MTRTSIITVSRKRRKADRSIVVIVLRNKKLLSSTHSIYLQPRLANARREKGFTARSGFTLARLLFSIVHERELRKCVRRCACRGLSPRILRKSFSRTAEHRQSAKALRGKSSRFPSGIPAEKSTLHRSPSPSPFSARGCVCVRVQNEQLIGAPSLRQLRPAKLLTCLLCRARA